jgi:hypothetical protein
MSTPIELGTLAAGKGVQLPLCVRNDGTGYCIGTPNPDSIFSFYTRESVEAWESRDEAKAAFGAGAWTQRLYAYGNESYSKAENKTLAQLRAELRVVFDAYPEHNDPDLGSASFDDMVATFAAEDFYNLHYVAQRALALSSGLVDVYTVIPGPIRAAMHVVRPESQRPFASEELFYAYRSASLPPERSPATKVPFHELPLEVKLAITKTFDARFAMTGQDQDKLAWPQYTVDVPRAALAATSDVEPARPRFRP